MQAPNELNKLTDDEWRTLESRADEFAAALNKDGTVDWPSFLEGLTGNLRTAVLHEFIKIDLESAWKRGRRTFVDEYLRRFPELGGPYDLPAHLVFEEYRIRRIHGDKPESDSYFTRFPNLAETLRGMFSGSQVATRRDKPPVERSRAETLSRRPKSIDESVAQPLGGNRDSAPESMLPMAGQYELLELLGKGQFGEVFRARAPGGVEVAVKIITQPSDRETAKRELQALELVKNLRHPCLMSTLAFWDHQNKIHIVVELADGTLRDRLKECKKEGKTGVPAEELVEYFYQAADGLDFLHKKEIYHRDIKPDNILLVNGHAKVADFGLARAQDRVDASVSFAGTPAYMGPEVWGGKYSHKSDQYSLAITYVELRIGRRPLDGKDFVELMTRHLEDAPDLQELPAPERAVVLKALSKQMDQRYPTCKAFANALKGAVLGGNADGGSSSQIIIKQRGVPVPLVLLGVALVCIGLVAVFVFWPDGKKKDTEVANNGTTTVTTPVTSPITPITPKTGNGTVDPMPMPMPMPMVETVNVPPLYRKVAGTEIVKIGNLNIPRRIERDPIAGIVPTFVLIQPSGQGKTPYYMLETKVWNGVLASALASRDGNDRAASAYKANEANAAMGMSWVDANYVARQVFGGRLPTVDEWDLAVGWGEGMQAELAVAEGTAGINLKDVRPVNATGRDKSSAGVFDMLGNGREWTANMLLPDGSMKPMPDAPNSDTLVVLRGRSFTLARPLTADDLRYEKSTPQTQYATKGSKWTGMRVVIDLPK